MGPQVYQREAMGDLHQILFRPCASIFSPKPVKQTSFRTGKFIKLDSNVYSPAARSFLEEKGPPSADYFKSPKLYSQRSNAKGKSLHSPRWRREELLRHSLAVPDRKGGLSREIIKTIWGPTRRRKATDDRKLEAEADELIHKLRSKISEADNRVVESLMDVLLRNWVYFEHSNEKIPSISNHVHAKYCEGTFGHYLLGDGTQIHGYYVVSLRQLISELKALLIKLKAKITGITYKEVPIWKPPPLEEIPEFVAPEEKPMPTLYPIEGFLPIPEDDIPQDARMPLLQTPSLHSHPPYVKPKFSRKAAVLSIPPLDDFSKEERNLKPYKEVPPPTFNPPEPLPQPAWANPQEEPLPSMPISKEAKILRAPTQEILPPYEMPKMEPLPCEASYYRVDLSQPSICDGLCGRTKGSTLKSHIDIVQSACLAHSPRELPAPLAPTYVVIPAPTFLQPKEEPLPPFIPPTLMEDPPYVEPPKPNIPEWVPPSPPPPIGYLVGCRPVFLVDCSATMAGEPITCAQNALRHLFSMGGQVEVGATHFDIIMYSFDAWSFGALVEERKRMGATSRHLLKSLEYPGQFMQPKTHENMDKALSWMSQWRTGGTSNLKRAIEVAMQRTSADCIYLFTHGKCDRPVIIMNALKELELQRSLTPIYPVGIEPTKPQARILKNVLADITGGQYIELDKTWQHKLHREQTENQVSSEKKLLADRVAYWQRRSLEAGVPETADVVLNRLKRQYDMETRDPRMEAYRKEEEKAKLQHQHLLDSIREENRRAVLHAQDLYNSTHAIILEKNRNLLEGARKLWEADCQNIARLNKENMMSFDEWQTEVEKIERANKRSREEAQMKFKEDVKKIEGRNAYEKLHARHEYDEMVKRLRARNELFIQNHKKYQEELISKAKMNNESIWEDYEATCAKIKALNSSNLEKARREFALACEEVVKENQRRLKEAEEDHKWRFEVVTNANAKRKKEHQDKLEELQQKKLEARKSHQLRVTTLLAEHKASIDSLAISNQNLEHESKLTWEKSCKRIDEENLTIANKAYADWKEATRIIQMQNDELSRRRTNLQLRREEVERMNNELVRKKKLEWKETCRQLQEEYEEETAGAKIQHEDYVKELQISNARLVEAAKISHDAEVAAIKAYNESIRTFVEESELVEKEIKRIQDFLGHIIISQDNVHREKKSNKNRTLEQSLAMLANLDSPCPPKVIIEALQVAYAGDLKRKSEMFYEPTTKNEDEEFLTGKKRQHGRFSGMKQIHPSRARAHRCDNQYIGLDGGKVQNISKMPKNTGTAIDREPEEVTTRSVAPKRILQKFS